MLNVKSRGEKWETRWYKAIDEHFTFDLKPEKLNVKVNSRFFIKSDTRVVADNISQATNQQKATEQPASNHNYNGGNLLQLRHLLGPE